MEFFDVKTEPVEIGRWYSINDSKHNRNGQRGKCIDFNAGTRLIWLQNMKGEIFTANSNQLCKLFGTAENPKKENEWPGPNVLRNAVELSLNLQKNEDKRIKALAKGNDLADQFSSFDQNENNDAYEALDDRIEGYKRTRKIQEDTLVAADKVNALLEKRKRQREELEAWNNGTWFEEYWQPDYKKIGFTGGLQALNIAQLTACILGGPVFAVAGLTLFAGTLALNYYILKNNIVRTED